MVTFSFTLSSHPYMFSRAYVRYKNPSSSWYLWNTSIMGVSFFNRNLPCASRNKPSLWLMFSFFLIMVRTSLTLKALGIRNLHAKMFVKGFEEYLGFERVLSANLSVQSAFSMINGSLAGYCSLAWSAHFCLFSINFNNKWDEINTQRESFLEWSSQWLSWLMVWLHSFICLKINYLLLLL